MKKFLTLMIVSISFTATSQTPYFPPATGNTWDTISPASLGWCQDKVDALVNYVGNTNAKAFMILKDGKLLWKNIMAHLHRIVCGIGLQQEKA